ncbi:hypothetical protein SAMN05216502_104282 [Citrobacter amalonaticus]|uniref:Uncharacterized protein n=1 Tax=Citrobacter amalonaticus TaxID=35703 RepID=A0A6N2RWF4_CITAM|nr:hypothetical protein SAMN05216502_104282 [Citrobacter amalonaticus]
MSLNLATSGINDGCYFFWRNRTAIQPLVNRWLTNAADLSETLLAANDFQSTLNNFVHGFYLSGY